VLNSFAKSYVIERAARVGSAIPGVSGLMVNVGGDLVVRGRMTRTVGVADPRAAADNAAPLVRLDIRNRAVATSGGYHRGVEIGGRHYSHIVDPRTGRSTGHVLGATVVARRAVDAGALATAFCVLSPDESAALASTRPDVEFMLMLADGSVIESQGWRALASGPARSLPAPSTSLYAAGQATWDPKFELTVNLEVARTGGRRPYVAVWIEDGDRFPVRTLAVWYERNHSKWLADLRAWYRGDRLRSLAEGTSLIDTVSSATRSPGAYALVWDGKDNQGRLVKAGTYTVVIEAAREHGTYQIMRQVIDIPGAARQVALPGNAEIAAASLDYHPIGTR
jgi:FAD:protein FMN transferase